MKSELLSTGRLNDKAGGFLIKSTVMHGEIEGLHMEFISLKGANQLYEKYYTDYYSVLLSLKGKAILILNKDRYEFNVNQIVRIPFQEHFNIQVEKGEEFHFLLIKKKMDKNDLDTIKQNLDGHSSFYIKALNDCPVYSEDIKSSKSINRMILPVGMVPRLCMGSVETTGPDSVGEHEHPMLDQLFLGMGNCTCTCKAGSESTLLIENMLLHIPLGSNHSVSVADGDFMSYIWFDFFFTQTGQDYIDENHKIKTGD